MKYKILADFVGNTPLVRLQKLNPNSSNTILLKLEGNNPAGSVKDRPALNMIQAAEDRHEIKPGDTLIEATSGNTGIALAMAAAVKGYNLTLIMPETMTMERRAAMAAFGADLVLVSEAQGMEGARDVAPERDAFEAALLDWGLTNDTPILGVCRGMQFINQYFGGTNCEVSEHVGRRHRISFSGDMSDIAPMDVNSFHNWGLRPEGLGKKLAALALAEDGTVEALAHATRKVAGVMWHPEREEPISEFDLSLTRRFLEL